MSEKDGNGKEASTGTGLKIYIPMGLGNYTIPREDVRTLDFAYRNELVDHVINSLEKRKNQSPYQGTIDDIFEDRLTLIRSKIELIVMQLSQRKEIHREIMYRIALDSCKAQNLLNERIIRTFTIDRERINLERMKLDLEQQGRREEAGYFNDTAFLNRELRDVLIQYQEEIQKTSMISNMEGET